MVKNFMNYGKIFKKRVITNERYFKVSKTIIHIENISIGLIL